MPPQSSRKQMRRPRDTAQSAAAGIYDSLVAEVTSATDLSSHDERPLKRRKAGPRPRATPSDAPTKRSMTPPSSQQVTPATSRTIQDASDQMKGNIMSDDDDDLDFEDVELQEDDIIELSSDENLADVNVTLGQQNLQPGTESSLRRRVASRTDRLLRILGHKAHFVALMGHCHIVNSRCNDRRAQKVLKSLLTKTVQDYLKPNEAHTQFQQNRTFIMGLERAADAFKGAFEVTASGMRRAYWPGDGHDTISVDPIEIFNRADFVAAAKNLSGSQDVGNQLFCTLMRAVGIKARLVCSLQVLPLSNTPAAPSTPSKPSKPIVFAIAPDYPLDKTSVELSLKEKATASARRRLGQPAFRAQPVERVSRPKRIHKQSQPIFWTEVLNPALQKWTPVDPIVTHTVGKSVKIEPPGSCTQNQLVYAISFDRYSVAKDVTRRYAKQYNAKTRRLRLDSLGETEAAWLQAIMARFSAKKLTNRRKTLGEIEEAELVRHVAGESMPKKIQDFKGHPVYALERHIRRYEVIHPRRESGKINVGTAADPRMEPIFRRSDVHICRSADQWYRQGRIVKAAEHALKKVPARVQRKDYDDEQNDEPDTTALYIEVQTEEYVPPPVLRGKVPRNGFGNLDIYVDSMIPRGGAHIRHPLANQAAEILQIDAVDAVTGLKFSGRKCTTVVEGVVIPERYTIAVEEVIEGLIWQELHERSCQRSALALRMWKRFLQGLRIAERVASYATEPITKEEPAVDPSTTSAWFADEDIDLHTAGQYTLDELSNLARAAKVKPKTKKRQLDFKEDDSMHDADESDIGLFGDERSEILDEMEGGFVHARSDTDMNDEGGGFVVSDDDNGGGFVIDSNHAHDNHLKEFRPADQGDTSKLESQEGGPIVDESGKAAEAPDPMAAIELSEDTHNHIVISTSTSDYEQQASIVWRQPQYQRSKISDDDLSHGSLPSSSQNADGKRILDDESMQSHDPEDEDAEPDWMESD